MPRPSYLMRQNIVKLAALGLRRSIRNRTLRLVRARGRLLRSIHRGFSSSGYISFFQQDPG